VTVTAVSRERALNQALRAGGTKGFVGYRGGKVMEPAPGVMTCRECEGHMFLKAWYRVGGIGSRDRFDAAVCYEGRYESDRFLRIAAEW